MLAVPCLQDNYAWLLRCEQTRFTAVVDPSEAPPVLAALRERAWKLDAILCTHHHFDHVGGVEPLREQLGPLPVFGFEGERERIPGLDRPLADGAEVTLGALKVRALHVPAHTRGALAFVVDEEHVFTGDTAFCGGCGRLFEGTAADMERALCGRLGALGDAVSMYPGHEYALKNLRFALTIEPDNEALRARLAAVEERRSRGEHCAPSTLGLERATNPFFRVREEAVRAWARQRGSEADPVSVLAAVRAARDVY